MSTAKIEELDDRITGYFVDMGLSPEPLRDGVYAFQYGRTVLLVSLFVSAGRTWVRVATTLLRDFRPNLELVTRVLRLNTEVLLGSFLIFEDDTLTFTVTLPGAGLDLEHLGVAIDHVARVSNAYGEELRAIAGGRLAVESQVE